MGAFSDTFAGRRADALVRAAKVLTERGFAKIDERRWVGPLASKRVEIALANRFPDILPEISLVGDDEIQVAHVERLKRICIAAKSGTTIDWTRPEQVLIESLRMAEAVLSADPEQQHRDIQSEFLGYWPDLLASELCCYCDPNQRSGEIWIADVEGIGPFAASSRPDLERWCERTGRTHSDIRSAYFLRLTALPSPPVYEAVLQLRNILSLIDAHSDPSSEGAFRTWLFEHGVPSTLVLSAPGTGARVVFAVDVPELSDDVPGFRPGRAPVSVQVARARGEPVVRRSVVRLDPEYLIARAGGIPELHTKQVAVIGCGAVGSHVAGALAECGIGHLLLVDHDRMQADNIHRHLLGAADIGAYKVDGLQAHLVKRFPHLQIRVLPQRVEEALDAEPDAFRSVDLIVVAIAEDNVEFQINEFLWNGPRRLHVWLEPLGLGGHVLRITGAHAGCFACLYRRDEQHGLVNMAAIVQPGQKVQRTLAGCAGTYHPFGAFDAQRAGVEAAQNAMTCLTETTLTPRLVSWVISKAEVRAARISLSRRGDEIPEGCTRVESAFAAADCPVCVRSET